MIIFNINIILLFYNTYFTLYSPSPDRIIQYYLAGPKSTSFRDMQLLGDPRVRFGVWGGGQ